MIDTANLSLRPAYRADAPAIASLMVQLYHAELPGTLRGPIASQQALVRYILERGNGAFFRRFIACDADGRGVATASFRMGRDRLSGGLPSGTLWLAVRQLGMVNAFGLFATLLRAGLTPTSVLGSNDAYIYNVVVDERLRGAGVGAWLVGQIEQLAWHEGARTAWLRVVVGNERAKRLYTHLGYRVVERTPAALDWLMVASELMAKPLQAPA